MKIFYTHRAIAQFERLPKTMQVRLAKKMSFFAEQENPLLFAERLTDFREGEYRFRIGDYRVIFDLEFFVYTRFNILWFFYIKLIVDRQRV